MQALILHAVVRQILDLTGSPKALASDARYSSLPQYRGGDAQPRRNLGVLYN